VKTERRSAANIGLIKAKLSASPSLLNSVVKEPQKHTTKTLFCQQCRDSKFL